MSEYQIKDIVIIVILLNIWCELLLMKASLEWKPAFSFVSLFLIGLLILAWLAPTIKYRWIPYLKEGSMNPFRKE